MLRKSLPVALSLIAFLGGAAGGELLRRDMPAAAESVSDGPAPAGKVEHEGVGAPEDPDAPAAPAAPEPEAPAPSAADHAPAAGHGAAAATGGRTGGHGEGLSSATAWFKFPQQFFVPILHDGRLDSTMILTLSIEMPLPSRETVHAHEIKLRDALLRQLLIHANTGGFDGNFTTEAHLRKLRGALTATAQGVVPEIAGILIGDIARQER